LKYAFPQLANESMFISRRVVERELRRAGHTVTVEIEPDCDAVLFSACDVTDMMDLIKLRKQTGKLIILGGQYAYNYWSAGLYADIVWLGHVFDFAELRTIDDIVAHQSAYTGDDSHLVSSQRVDYGKIALMQTAPEKSSYLGGVGCQNRCAFCFTAWVNKHTENSQGKINAAIVAAKSKKLHLMVVSNSYTDNPELKTKDMLIRDYLKTSVSGNVVRLGIEFATEETRRKMHKPITRDEIFATIQKAKIENLSLRLFHISGYDNLNDWEQYVDDLCQMVERVKFNRLLHLKFTNLQYQNYTPLYAERRNIDPSKYIDSKVTRRWFDKLRTHTKSVLVGPPSPFPHVAARMGVELARDKDTFDFWLRQLRNPKMTNGQAHEELIKSGVFDTQRRIMKIDGRIFRIE
jgi:hypothetical protein